MHEPGKWKGKFKGEDMQCNMQFFDRFTRIQGQGQLVSDKARKFDVEGKGTMPETSDWMGWWAGHDIEQGPSNFFLKDF